MLFDVHYQVSSYTRSALNEINKVPGLPQPEYIVKDVDPEGF